jgi:hypothetical protein
MRETIAHKCAPTKKSFSYCSKNEQSARRSLKMLVRDISPHGL